MTVLGRLIEEGQWDIVALCLALGLVRAINRSVPDALPEIFDLLDGYRD